MKDFFNSLRFKILIAVFTVMLGFMIMAVYTGGSAPLISQVFSIVTVPVQRFSARISYNVSGFFDKFMRAGELYDENSRLQEEVNDLRRRLVDYEEMKHENEQFREFLGVRENRQEMEFEIASVIARDPNERFYSFTIDKGSLGGIEALDPVMTADGLVGYVYEVGMNHAKVLTLLDVQVDVGAYCSSTRDIGIVTGTFGLAPQGMCLMQYLPRDSAVAPGDLVLTSGGSLFPRDIVIGKVTGVEPSSHGTSLVATIEAAADIRGVKNVFVITHFEGQGIN